MGKPLKTRAELTFEDFLRLKGSRWKAALGDKLPNALEAVKVVCKDTPALMHYYAAELFDSEAGIKCVEQEEYVSELYTLYFDNEDVILALIPTLGGHLVPNTEIVHPTETLSVSLGNPALDAAETEFEELHTEFTSTKQQLISLSADTRRAITKQTNCVIAMDIKKEEIATYSLIPVTEHSIAKILEDTIAWCSTNNALVISADSTTEYNIDGKDVPRTLNIYVLFRPREMYNPDQIEDKGWYTQPIVLQLWWNFKYMRQREGNEYCRGIKPVERGQILDINGTYSQMRHPHVGTYVCLGDEDTPVHRALAAYDMETALNRVNAVLTCYNAGSPFIKWADWKDKLSYNVLKDATATLLRDFVVNNYYNKRTLNAPFYTNDYHTINMPSRLQIPTYFIKDILGDEAFDNYIANKGDVTLPQYLVPSNYTPSRELSGVISALKYMTDLKKLTYSAHINYGDSLKVTYHYTDEGALPSASNRDSWRFERSYKFFGSMYDINVIPAELAEAIKTVNSDDPIIFDEGYVGLIEQALVSNAMNTLDVDIDKAIVEFLRMPENVRQDSYSTSIVYIWLNSENKLEVSFSGEDRLEALEEGGNNE